MSDSGNNSVCDPTPPWLLGKPQNYADEVTLHDEIQLFCKWISPTRVCIQPIPPIPNVYEFILGTNCPHTPSFQNTYN